MRCFNLSAALVSLSALTLSLVSCGTAPTSRVGWREAPRVASGDARYDLGVSAMYAVATDEALLIAGGANFPDAPVADGGSKAFYDHIYMYADGEWRRVGCLPEPAAYGVSYRCGQRAVFAGGAGAQGALRDVYMIGIMDEEAVISTCASLPCAIEQAAGASIDGRLYLFGGIADGRPSAALYMLDLSDDAAEWRELAPAPEPLVQPVAAASGGRLYVWGGFDSASKDVVGRGYCYDPQCDEWSEAAGHPDGGTFTGGCAVTLADGRILCAGGVDREIFAAALRLPAGQMYEYLTQPVDYYRFQRTLRIFDPATGEWQCAGEAACAVRAGASMVLFGGDVWLLGGELKPGVRTPENFYTTDFS